MLKVKIMMRFICSLFLPIIATCLEIYPKPRRPPTESVYIYLHTCVLYKIQSAYKFARSCIIKDANKLRSRKIIRIAKKIVLKITFARRGKKRNFSILYKVFFVRADSFHPLTKALSRFFWGRKNDGLEGSRRERSGEESVIRSGRKRFA